MVRLFTRLSLLIVLSLQFVFAHPIDLNRATKAELTLLKGIGDTRADAIIDYRNESPFESVDELLNVKGIGPAIFAAIKDEVVIESNETDTPKDAKKSTKKESSKETHNAQSGA